MTVSELISELMNFPQDLKVVVRGYENGYNEIVTLKKKTVLLNGEAEWWDGEYMDSGKKEGFGAIELFGENRIAAKIISIWV